MDLVTNTSLEDILKEWDLYHLYDKFKGKICLNS